MQVIVVGVDGSPASLAALRTAAAHARHRGVLLRVVHAYRPSLALPRGAGADGGDPDGLSAARTLMERALVEAADDLAGLAMEHRILCCRVVGRALVADAATASLLVVGSTGADRSRGRRLGGVSEHVTRHARCSFLVVPPGGEQGDGRIVVGVDGSRGADHALRWATGEASRRAMRLEVVHAYRPYPSHRPFGAEFMEAVAPGAGRRAELHGASIIEDALDRVAVDRAAISITTSVVAGHPADALSRVASGASMVVIGARGTGATRLRLGSVAHELLRHPAVPVLVVRDRKDDPDEVRLDEAPTRVIHRIGPAVR